MKAIIAAGVFLIAAAAPAQTVDGGIPVYCEDTLCIISKANAVRLQQEMGRLYKENEAMKARGNCTNI